MKEFFIPTSIFSQILEKMTKEKKESIIKSCIQDAGEIYKIEMQETIQVSKKTDLYSYLVGRKATYFVLLERKNPSMTKKYGDRSYLIVLYANDKEVNFFVIDGFFRESTRCFIVNK